VSPLAKRARAKYISVPLAVKLAELRSPLEQAYRNTVYCAGTLAQEGGKLTGKYCGNRWCLVCNRVRIARAINRYAPVLEGWTDKWFVTLTLRNVAGADLSATVEGMIHTAQEIRRGITRTDRLTFRALRKLECTYNAERNDFHPHFHFVVEGRAQADALVRRWLAAHHDTATADAQDVRACDNGSLHELFKYFTKVLAKARDGRARPVPPAALDLIFRAMKGRRVYQPMGFTAATEARDEDAPIDPAEATEATTRQSERVLWEWLQDCHDWVDLSTGEVLTGYQPTFGFRALVEAVGIDPPD